MDCYQVTSDNSHRLESRSIYMVMGGLNLVVNDKPNLLVLSGLRMMINIYITDGVEKIDGGSKHHHQTWK